MCAPSINSQNSLLFVPASCAARAMVARFSGLREAKELGFACALARDWPDLISARARA